jgi:thioredoxin-dependent peroxiredoxin
MPRLTPGLPAPDFTLTDHTGREFSLSGLRGSKVIIFCYPAAMTPGCTKQARDFQDSLKALHSNGFQVIGISPDPPQRLAEFAERESLTYPLLADPGRQVLTTWGAFGEKKLYGKVVTAVIRSTIVLDQQGVVTLARYNVRATGHVASLRKALGL